MQKYITDHVAELQQQVRDLAARLQVLEQRIAPSQTLQIIKKAGAALAPKKKADTK